MNGTSHTIIGAATGFIIASNFQSTPEATIALVGLGGIAGLIPDLDIGGKLRNKITMPQIYIRRIAQFISILLIIYSFFMKTGTSSYIGAGIGVGMFLAACMFKQKHMLMITGIGVFSVGYFLKENWILLFGIYIFIASISPHRSYTHSLLGL